MSCMLHTYVQPLLEPSVEAMSKPSVEVTRKPSVEVTRKPSVEATSKPSVEATSKPSVGRKDLSEYVSLEEPMATSEGPVSEGLMVTSEGPASGGLMDEMLAALQSKRRVTELSDKGVATETRKSHDPVNASDDHAVLSHDTSLISRDQSHVLQKPTKAPKPVKAVVSTSVDIAPQSPVVQGMFNVLCSQHETSKTHYTSTPHTFTLHTSTPPPHCTPPHYTPPHCTPPHYTPPHCTPPHLHTTHLHTAHLHTSTLHTSTLHPSSWLSLAIEGIAKALDKDMEEMGGMGEVMEEVMGMEV